MLKFTPLFVVVFALCVAPSLQTASCSTWTKCWTCADNSDSEDGGCSWSGSTCSQSDSGTTDSSDCDDLPASNAAALECQTSVLSDTCKDMCCQDFIDCIYDVLHDEGSMYETDSSTGKVIETDRAEYEKLCKSMCKSSDCSSASMLVGSVALMIAALSALFSH
eukprot:c4482_g1_i1.p2 GENE.c4482_g1_i1~~c4482_g1_i1.p2  ORF type:complete len:164 (-),score=28.07 c4482_g1_i1:20-511(-)